MSIPPLQPADVAADRYIRSRDWQSQIRAAMTDDLHRLVWGWMSYSNRPFDVPLVETADPIAWVKASRRQAPPIYQTGAAA